LVVLVVLGLDGLVGLVGLGVKVEGVVGVEVMGWMVLVVSVEMKGLEGAVAD